MRRAVPPVLPVARLLQAGGLADVVMSLAKAHQASGSLVEVILPKYDCIHYGERYCTSTAQEYALELYDVLGGT